MNQKNTIERKWDDKTKYYTYDVPLFSEEDIMTFSMEIIKKGVNRLGKPLNTSSFLLILKEKLDEVAQERAINQNEDGRSN